jgi:hypothetical integral membrane protein (TIGR02206 family)
MHAVAVCMFVASVVLIVIAGRAWRGTARERALRQGLAWSIVATQVVSIVWFAMPARFDWGVSLPLQFCDVLPWVGAIALWRGSAWARSVVYFVGLGLTTQAFVSPTVQVGPLSLHFWIFWTVHAQILGCGLYAALVQGWKPGPREYAMAVIGLWCYSALILPFDIVTGLNYGFMGPSKPRVPTAIDAMGAWPGRLVLMFAVVHAAMGLLLVPWVVRVLRGGVDSRR